MNAVNCVYIALFVVSCMNTIRCLLLTGSFNTSLQVSVGGQNGVAISYPYDETITLNDIYLRVFVEAVMEVNDSVLITIKIHDDIVRIIKLTNNFNTSIVKTERSICPTTNVNTKTTLKAYISSSSRKNITVRIEIKMLDNFTLRLGQESTFEIDDMSPVFFRVRFDRQMTHISVKVTSLNNSCMIISVQDAKCPVYDLLENVKFIGTYQTVTLKGSLTLETHNYDSRQFYVVFIHNSNNKLCGNGPVTVEGLYGSIKKRVNVTVSSTPDYMEYLHVNLVVLGIYMIFFAVALLISMKIYRDSNTPFFCCGSKSLKDLNSDMEASQTLTSETSDKLDSADLNLEPPNPYKDNYLYIWMLVIFSAFYSIPVIQLFITHLQMVRNTGNVDVCYYNTFCLRPFYQIVAFNNILSNMGYMILGSLTLIITYMKHNHLGNFSPFLNDQNQRIHNDFSIFYAMGLTMIMEGIMSALYHVCPTKDNFQFDTTYMYVMAGLYIIRIQQIRIPDMNTTPKWFFITIATIVFVGIVGQRNNNLWFWIVFIFINTSFCFVVTLRWYHLGQAGVTTSRIIASMHNLLRGRCEDLRPDHGGRFAVLFLVNSANFGLTLYGVIFRPKDFQIFLLIVLFVVFFGFMAYYLVNKIYYAEHCRIGFIIYIVLAVAIWSLAGECYSMSPIDSEVPLAISREKNADCIIGDFYDVHDLWHFLTSLALFFQFLAIQSIDDDIQKNDLQKTLKIF